MALDPLWGLTTEEQESLGFAREDNLTPEQRRARFRQRARGTQTAAKAADAEAVNEHGVRKYNGHEVQKRAYNRMRTLENVAILQGWIAPRERQDPATHGLRRHRPRPRKTEFAKEKTKAKEKEPTEEQKVQL